MPKLSLERSSLVTGEGVCGGSSDAEKSHSSVCTLPSTPDEQLPVWGASSITRVQHFSRCAQALSTSFRLDHGEAKVAQSCPPLCGPMDCCLPGSSVHGILQARILEWVAISFSKGSSQPRDRTQGLRHCRQTLYCLSHQGSPSSILAWRIPWTEEPGEL